MRKITLIIVALCMLSIFAIQAFRFPPEHVEPVIHEGIKYKDSEQIVGYIEAWDVEKDELLWELKIYEIKYDEDLEADVQDIFIISLEIEDEKLIIINEAGDKFTVDLDTREVMPKGKVYNMKEMYQNSF